YEALSHVWGDPSKTKAITINGTPFSVTGNREAALLRLRRADTERILWVDALYINQVDDVEKSREVMRMRAIYYGAQRVVVDLGPED
ncbi:heterokaryon incompatibility, partial [Immersiella caudata]